MPVLICNAFAAGCIPDWNGVAAVATTLATAAALGVATNEAWRRRRETRDSIREACSAVDRLVAYREIALAIAESRPVYIPELDACKLILKYAGVQKQVIAILKGRPTMSDGALNAMIAADDVADSLKYLETPDGRDQDYWHYAIIALRGSAMSAAIAAVKCNGVRKHYHWGPSKAAENIRIKYQEVIDECALAKAEGRAPRNFDLLETAY